MGIEYEWEGQYVRAGELLAGRRVKLVSISRGATLFERDRHI